MRYELVADPDAISGAFAEFRRFLGASDRVKHRHENRGFWVQRWFAHGQYGPHDAVAFGLIGSHRSARVTVKPSDPSRVDGLIVSDEHGRRYVTHGGKFSDTTEFKKNTDPRAWIEVAGDSRKRRYLITRLDDIAESEVLDNFSRFVKSRFKLDHRSVVEQQYAARNVKSRSEVTLNRVLYGPPGTSKTFDAVSMAVEVVDGHLPDTRAEVRDRFNELREAGQAAFVTFHQNYAYEEFIEGIRPVLDEKTLRYELRDGIFKQIATRAKENQGKRHVLIIDEINRGNIAKIFGELITLIEPSKRLGCDDETEATLTYSKDPFGVPGNLYLIGTMNTADRGIALLDMALRRRFRFIERMPDMRHVSDDIEGVDGQRLLRAINERIVETLDRDHQIGHTYLMGIASIEALADAFQAQVIPLLQEYFYDDWEKMHRVLNGNAFITRRDASERTVFDLLPCADERWQQAESYRAIYRGNDGDGLNDSE